MPEVSTSYAGKKQEPTRAAIGLRVHSGWGVLVAMSSKPEAVEILERRRIEIINSKASGAAQPYHFAAQLKIRDAQKHLSKCAAMAITLARAGTREVVSNLQGRGYAVVAAVILLSSGRPLPGLVTILASHPMIHAAEGEFFRRAFRQACENLKIPVEGIRERELDSCASAAFGKGALQVKRRIDAEGHRLGPPWTTDQKTAALAAVIVLAQSSGTHQ